MSGDLKKRGVAFWATVVIVVLLVAYPLSFGPACWWLSQPVYHGFTASSTIPTHVAPQFYWPIGWLAVRVNFVRAAAARYAHLGMRSGSVIAIPEEPSGNSRLFVPDTQ